MCTHLKYRGEYILKSSLKTQPRETLPTVALALNLVLLMQVVRICDGTLKKRLNELDETGALDMSPDECAPSANP